MRIRFSVPSFGKGDRFQSIATEHLSEQFSGSKPQFRWSFGFVGGTLGFPNTLSLLGLVQVYWSEVVVMEGWLLHPENGWAYRFHRDEKSWMRDPMVFVDQGRGMPDGSPALLKSRRHLHRDQAREVWVDLLKRGYRRVPAVWGPSSGDP